MGGQRSSEGRVSGMGLLPTFTLSMFVALTIVMVGAGAVLYLVASELVANTEDRVLHEATRLTATRPLYEAVDGAGTRIDAETRVESTPILYGDDRREGRMYAFRPQEGERARGEHILVPGGLQHSSQGLLGLIIGVLFVVILVGAGVASLVSRNVAGPIEKIIEDIRKISRGNLRSLGNVKGPREVKLLARSIDRMTADLEAAQEAEMELAVRERELELAGGVREALLPVATPLISGYDLGSAHLSSRKFGGDFHDWIELEDGRVGLLVCDVSGSGVPAALVGATARSYLRNQLLRGDDVEASLHQINRELARDVRRGMFVTALYVLVDPRAHEATVACAGHKLPLVRYTASDQKMRLIHPEGIALAFDQGPVFERALRVERVPLEPGDRLILSNTGPVRIQDAAGDEMGEKRFYRLAFEHAAEDTGRFLKAVRRGIEAFAAGGDLPADVSLVTIQREA